MYASVQTIRLDFFTLFPSQLSELSGPEKLQQSSLDTLGVPMQGSKESGANGSFPRSSVMRLMIDFAGVTRIFRQRALQFAGAECRQPF
jgi:hypothetical protein